MLFWIRSGQTTHDKLNTLFTLLLRTCYKFSFAETFELSRETAGYCQYETTKACYEQNNNIVLIFSLDNKKINYLFIQDDTVKFLQHFFQKNVQGVFCVYKKMTRSYVLKSIICYVITLNSVSIEKLREKFSCHKNSFQEIHKLLKTTNHVRREPTYQNNKPIRLEKMPCNIFVNVGSSHRADIMLQFATFQKAVIFLIRKIECCMRAFHWLSVLSRDTQEKNNVKMYGTIDL